MKIQEYQAKDLFLTYGIPVGKHMLCHTVEEALEAYKQMDCSEVVIKAQVLTGGRGKAGGVKLAGNAEEVSRYASEILHMTIKGFPVEAILIDEAARIKAEYYISFVIDRNTRSVVLIMSASGGMDIEEIARNSPEKIIKFAIDPLIGIPDYLAKKFAFLLFDRIDLVKQLAPILQKLYKAFVDFDASLAEINPLVLTDLDRLVAVDAKMVADDNALYRHPDIQALSKPTPDEKTEAEAREKGFSYVRMDGEIGCMVNGAGLAMATMDMIKLYGGSPANFLDIGGSSNPTKVIEAMKLLLRDGQVKVVLINIFGGITRCDDVATGLLEAFRQMQTDVPVIVRLTGTNEQAGRDLLSGSRFLVAETMGSATLMAVDFLKRQTI